MPHKDPEKRKEYMREYHKKYNRDKQKQKVAKKKYLNSPKGQMKMRVDKWISRGVKLRPDEDWDSVYTCWMITNECMICDSDISSCHQKCLDHDHETGFIRSVCCKKCNHHTNEI